MKLKVAIWLSKEFPTPNHGCSDALGIHNLLGEKGSWYDDATLNESQQQDGDAGNQGGISYGVINGLATTLHTCISGDQITQNELRQTFS